jgi:hypothetical protein
MTPAFNTPQSEHRARFIDLLRPLILTISNRVAFVHDAFLISNSWIIDATQ